MRNKTVIPCGGLSLSGSLEAGTDVLPLTVGSGKRGVHNVTLEIQHLPQQLQRPIPTAFRDLLDIATYVYTADQATTRGGVGVDVFGANWRRHFEFHIPVRMPDFWNSNEVKTTLRNTLEFLSDDNFDFTFYPAREDQLCPDYFQKSLFDESATEPEGVALFSGGLDSLAGAVEAAIEHKQRLMLVNHRPTPKLNTIHRKLEELLAKKAGGFRPRHLHVEINKSRHLNREYTQRTRSFLYVALGATVARMMGHQSVRFFENGVVSMNLPVCAQVVGSAATRTTHPRTLNCFGDLLTRVAGVPFTVGNPFIWDTKGQVVGKILKAECGELISHSISCAHTWLFTKKHPHCGTCSQCIDRRFGIIAAGAEAFEDAGGYVTDIFTGARSKEEDRMMMATYVERANQVKKLSGVGDLMTRFPESVRLLGDLQEKPIAAAEKVLTLYKRHATEVSTVVDRMLERNVAAIRERTLPKDCLLRIVYESGASDGPPVEIKPRFQKKQEARLHKPAEKRSIYRLRKSLKNWLLVFKGDDEVLPDERGVQLVEYLLKHPPEEPIHATALETLIDGVAVGTGIPGADIGGVIQEGSGKQLNSGENTILKQKLGELKAAMDDETMPVSERDKARDEYNELVHAASHGPKMPDAAGRVADRVRKAMRRLIDDLKGVELRAGVPNTVLREFGDHLEQCLWLPSMGGRGRAGACGKPGCFTYIRPTGVVWRD
jgi:7-cyano-7-deazaguanine synthase in queuosine biosynthesis